MKINNELDINPFEDGREALLDGLVQKYRAVKQMILDKKLTRKEGEKEIPLAPHDSNYAKVFNDLYKIEISAEEMIELRDFAENEYDTWIKYLIYSDRKMGMIDINLNNIQ